jgi:hypothetical protein
MTFWTGPYRPALLHCISRLMALSGESHGGEFTSAFGGVAEVHGRTAPIAFEANRRLLFPDAILKAFEANAPLRGDGYQGRSYLISLISLFSRRAKMAIQRPKPAGTVRALTLLHTAAALAFPLRR